MRVGVTLPNYGPLATPETIVRLARLAEDLGVDSVWVSDHLVAPAGVRSIRLPGTTAPAHRGCGPGVHQAA
jgi:alkanesulfonate monooxygenase SsuD/methylene tetrahydromethanopterin reductase-like flavin-dependent oxidoreductase (luciferase family)